MDKVYVVTGSSGSYDDYHTWNVRAFADPKEAEAYREKLQAINDAQQGVQAEWQERYEAADLNTMPDDEYEALMAEEGAGLDGPAHYQVEVVAFGAEAGEESHG
jgi:hypothetical protein